MDIRLKKIILGLTPAIFVTLGLLGWRTFVSGDTESNAALSINLAGGSEEVWVDGDQRGTTPFYSDTLRPGEVQVQVASWSARLTLTSRALTAVNLDIGGRFTKEEIFWLERSGEAKVSVVSDPEGAEVMIDGRSQGVTPLFIPITPGAYTLEVFHEGYEGSNLKVQAQPGYKLNAWFKLRPEVIPEQVLEINPSDWGWKGEDSLVTLFDYSVSDPEMFLSSVSWVKAVVDALARDSKERKPIYFLDRDGTVYVSSGEEMDAKDEIERSIVAAYLGEVGGEIPQAAKDGFFAFLDASFPEQSRPKVRILPTGVGFLRVRSGPGTSYTEIAKVHPGEIYPFLEDESGWYRLLLSDGREGWITGRWMERVEE